MRSVLFLALLFHSTSYFAQIGYSILSIPKELTTNANSVVLEELIEIDVSNISKMKVKKRRVVAVLNKLGDSNLELYEFYSSNSRVKNIDSWIYNAIGKEMRHFKKKDFSDVSRTGGNMYVDARVLYLNYTPTSYPYIAVFTSETESGDTAFIDSWWPLNDYAEGTQRSVYKLKYDASNKPRYKANNLDGYDISIEENPEELIFSASNLKPIRYEEHSPIGRDIFPSVLVALNSFNLKGTLGAAEDWEQFGKWMEQDLLADVREIPEGTLAKVSSLVANETTNEGKARKIYQFVQDKVRYISVQIGIGGWKPMPAQEVDKLGYGDCKALTNYTKALLDAVGVPSYYTVLYGDIKKWDILEDFASVQGNHVILGVPDGDEITWLECTNQDVPYGYIGNFTNDRQALIITPEGGKIARTKIYETAENTQENFAKIIVGSDGKITAEFNSVSKGLQYGDKYPLAKKKADEIDKYYKERWRYINGFSISDLKFVNDKKIVGFNEKMRLQIPNYANSVGSDFLFCPNVFNQKSYVPPRIEDRKQKLYIGYGYIDIDTVDIEIPENFIIEAVPDPTVIETKFGKYEIAFTQTSENKLRYIRKIQIEKGEYPPSEYENYRDFLRTIARLDKSKVLLKKMSQ
ncbi:DUF3857 domain-containing protein [Aequorivita sp. H23M31]|uniref:DUF3857 domain-containing protein n=1 Tax=Aequorivita ciconiae TaxID=2494375 RepID=A0A410G2W7_9FLAO|nr:DUF3857 domain-containing protein [Aequorivita sp. H23M31]QAA81622.1 DUF3857 domain-containing protein [Aequorivita sp. H23M31]